MTVKPPKISNPVAVEYTKPSRFRNRKKDEKPVRRDHPLHQPYERDHNWKNKLNDELD